MQKPDLRNYLLFAEVMPDPATTAQHLSAIITLVQAAKAALRDNEPENARRAEVALTSALGALATMSKQFDKTTEWFASNS